MDELDSIVVSILRDEILARVKELIEQKHLYQSVRVDTSAVEKLIDDLPNSKGVEQIRNTGRVFVGGPGRPIELDISMFIQNRKKQINETMAAILETFWTFRTDENDRNIHSLLTVPKAPTAFVLPTVAVTCEQCDAVLPPHNSGYRGLHEDFPDIKYAVEKNATKIYKQTFLFLYQCQACKQEPLVFLIHREGVKLMLCGRNHFEAIQVPKYVPKTVKEYYSDAIVAFNTGNILAGLFMLRTTIEQYMRSITEIKGKISGDDLADQYAKLLDDEFPKKYQSLKVVYDELSAKLHDADKSSEQFQKSRQAIDKHFQQLQLLPLKAKSNSEKAV